MPYINVNLKVRGGKRTPVETWATLTATNERTIEFANGNSVSGSDIADVAVTALQAYLRELQSRRPGHQEKSKLFIITAVSRDCESKLRASTLVYKLLAEGVPSVNELIELGVDISKERDLVSVDEVSSTIWDIVDGHVLGGEK